VSDAPHEHEAPYLRAIPRPTPWPLITAFGCTLVFAGIVTHVLVSVTGAACAIVGLVGWFREVFPHEATEEIPIAQCEIPLPAPVLAPRSAPRHTVRKLVPEEIHPYRSGLVGGLIGAAAMAIVAAAWGIIDAGSIWMPINLLAGVVLPSIGSASEEALKSFNGTWFACSAFLHVSLSLMVGLIFVVALPMMPKRPLIAGGIIAPILWTGVAWASLHVVNPTLEQHISWPWFLASQIAFGCACGGVVARFNMVRLQFGQTIAERLDVEQSKGGSR
jgi:hypothetical protein